MPPAAAFPVYLYSQLLTDQFSDPARRVQYPIDVIIPVRLGYKVQRDRGVVLGYD